MSRSFIFIFAVLFSFTSLGQFEENNKWSLDLGGGFTNAVKPYTDGYFSNTYDLFHASGGVRYMFNNKYGFKVDFGYDRITNDDKGDNGYSLPFQTDYYRASLQGFADLGRMLMFENFTNHLSLLFHAGGGFSMLRSDTVSFDGEDERMVNLMFGFTPQVKLGKRAALFLDASFIWHIYQQKTFDMFSPVAKRGFDGLVANLSLGLNIYLGKHEQHMDWAYSPCFPDMSYLENEIKKLDSANVVLQKKFQDDDGDGVINFLDKETDTPYGAVVDCDGKEKDADSSNLAVVPTPTPNVTPTPDVVPDSSPTTPEPDVTPDVTPTPTPDVTPTPSPDFTPTPTPDVTPTPTPDVTPTPTPDVTPTPTPDVTPTPTPDVTPTPTPDVTPRPLPVIDKAGLTSIGDVNFTINQAAVQSRFYPVLNETANLLKSISGSSIVIAGHADITGDESFNQKLALKRANSIKKYLMSRGIDSSRIEVVSFGETKPKFLNSTAAGRALNRRVEVYIK
jgi:outer membrane protein OmpA-like peptidoglycan-associated protein